MLLYFAAILSACGTAAETENSDYVPVSVEEQYVFSNFWCGYDFISYEGMPPSTKVKTLFKIDPNENGMFYIHTATQSSSVQIHDRMRIVCDFLNSSTLNCSGVTVNYVLRDVVLSTDLLPALIPGVKLTTLKICTKQELSNF